MGSTNTSGKKYSEKELSCRKKVHTTGFFFFFTFSNYFGGVILVVSISDSFTPVKSAKVEEVSRTGDICMVTVFDIYYLFLCHVQ